MDPFSALVLAFLIGGYFTKNVAQDLAWRARGEDPPSYRRQEARRKEREAKAEARGQKPPITGRQEARRFWANAWHDAWEEAHERRARSHEKRGQRRQEVWREEDEDEARRINREVDIAEARGQAPFCESCGNRCPEADLSLLTKDNTHGVVGVRLDRPTKVCPICRDRILGTAGPADTAPEDELLTVCGRCFRSVPASKTGDVEIDGVRVRACPTCRSGAANNYDVKPDSPDAEPISAPVCDTPPETLDAQPDDDSVVVPVDFSETDSRGASPVSSNGTANGAVSGETTNLRAAIAFAERMAAACTEGMNTAEQAGTVTTNLANSSQQGVGSVEQSISGLTGGGTTGPSIIALREAMDQLKATQGSFTSASQSTAQGRGGFEGAKAKFEAAVAQLRRQLAVTEQYEANKDAGEKSFVTGG